MALPKEFTGIYCSAVSDIFACSDEDEEVMSGHGSTSQVITCVIALGVVNDSSNSQVALGDANVHVHAVVL